MIHTTPMKIVHFKYFNWAISGHRAKEDLVDLNNCLFKSAEAVLMP